MKFTFLTGLLEQLKDKRRPWETWWERVAFLTDPRFYGKISGSYAAPGQM